ncbi:MAG: hypothetical protein LBG04_03915 [Holosporaceae bacterium]|jgi:predicted PP-loop superfamily ATPase|nr:hypothetical protein [Holosporaceae bacterium]
MSAIRLCKKCGFILGTIPGFMEEDGVCGACLNSERKKNIDFEERQKWLNSFIKENKTHSKYDCAVAVSGGKDSHAIVSRLVKIYKVTPLLISVTDEFSHTKAGEFNLDNLCRRFNLDLLKVRIAPEDFIKNSRNGFFNKLDPLGYIEGKLYEAPIEIAQKLGVKIIFFGENSSFEYGYSTELDIFEEHSNENVSVLYMGAIFPYSISDSLSLAREGGFRDTEYFSEWYRQGCVENYTQIDSVGYMVHIYLKFIKFGFQRVTDIATRFVREGELSRDQAMLLIKERDYICDPYSKKDFCSVLEISDNEFNSTIDKFANKDILVKDINGNWRRKDLI